VQRYIRRIRRPLEKFYARVYSFNFICAAGPRLLTEGQLTSLSNALNTFGPLGTVFYNFAIPDSPVDFFPCSVLGSDTVCTWVLKTCSPVCKRVFFQLGKRRLPAHRPVLRHTDGPAHRGGGIQQLLHRHHINLLALQLTNKFPETSSPVQEQIVQRLHGPDLVSLINSSFCEEERTLKLGLSTPSPHECSPAEHTPSLGQAAEPERLALKSG